MLKLSEGIKNVGKARSYIMRDSVETASHFKTNNSGFITLKFLILLSSDLNSSRIFGRFYFSKILKSEI